MRGVSIRKSCKRQRGERKEKRFGLETTNEKDQRKFKINFEAYSTLFFDGDNPAEAGSSPQKNKTADINRRLLKNTETKTF